MPGLQLAVQLYTLRARLAEDLEGTLGALAQAGAQEVELAGLYGRDGAGMRAALDAAGLEACSAHVPLDRFENEPELVVEEAGALDVEFLVVPSVPHPASVAEADAVVARLIGAAEVTRGAGLHFAYHNHDFEFRELEGDGDLWSRVTAAGLDHEPDVGWLAVAGRDPVAVLGELSGRVPLVHAKDVRRTADGGWEDVIAGDGDLDWPAIAEAAAAAGATRLIVELDNPSANPIDDVTLSLATLLRVL
jgi:sugar phosphate isomerase/epimerase